MAKNDDNDINESINNIIELKKLTKSENSIKDLKKSRNTTKKDKSHYKFKSKNEIAFKESYLRSKESNSKTKLQKVPPKQKKTVTRKKTTEPYLEDSSPNLESKYNKELKGQRLAYKTKKRNKVENQTSSKLKNIKNIAQKSKKTKKSPLDKSALSEKENKKSIFNNLFKTKPIHKTFQDQIADLTDSISSHKKYISLDYSKTDYSNIKTTKFEPKIAIDVKNVTMLFKLNTEKVDNLKEYFIKTVKGEIKTNELLALDNVSFTIKKGERWGIIGLNGAGKSTLLKIIAGVMKPTEGDVDVFGKVAPLLELGAGFDHNYTGRENIYLNGAILGYSKEFIEEKYDDIVEFSGLEKFIEVPIKNYSSGMKTKLGFSIATLVEPDILILDEILSVGDAKFRKKSGDKIKSMFDSGITVILVSHSINQIKDLCDKVLWLENGKIVMIGEVNEVCQAYEESTK